MSSDHTTIARPYAKAVFESAIESSKLSQWSDMLAMMASVVLEPRAVEFLTDPRVTTSQQIDFMTSIYGEKIDKQGQNLIKILAQNKRLLVLPDISALYEISRAEHEKTLAVEVLSYSALDEKQQQKLIESLSKRFNRKIVLAISIDESLLGGAIIRAGDVVIDGSVRGKLDKLQTELAA